MTITLHIFEGGLRRNVLLCVLTGLGEHSKKFELRVGMDPSPPTIGSNKNALCYYQDEPLGDGATGVFPCMKPIRGRYVTVQPDVHDFLHVCEVRVSGTCEYG